MRPDMSIVGIPMAVGRIVMVAIPTTTTTTTVIAGGCASFSVNLTASTSMWSMLHIRGAVVDHRHHQEEEEK